MLEGNNRNGLFDKLDVCWHVSAVRFCVTFIFSGSRASTISDNFTPCQRVNRRECMVSVFLARISLLRGTKRNISIINVWRRKYHVTLLAFGFTSCLFVFHLLFSTWTSPWASECPVTLASLCFTVRETIKDYNNLLRLTASFLSRQHGI